MSDPAATVAEARTTITVDQAIEESRYAHNRAVGSLRQVTWLPIACALAGLAASMVLLPTIYSLLFLVNPAFGIVLTMIDGGIHAAVAVMGYAVGQNLAARTYHRRYLLGMFRRGMPAQVEARYRVTDDAFEADTGRIAFAVHWPAVAEVVETPMAWLLVVDTTTLVVPRSAFADRAVERAFVAAILARIPPHAHDRSAEARAFVDAA